MNQQANVKYTVLAISLWHLWNPVKPITERSFWTWRRLTIRFCSWVFT